MDGPWQADGEIGVGYLPGMPVSLNRTPEPDPASDRRSGARSAHHLAGDRGAGWTVRSRVGIPGFIVAHRGQGGDTQEGNLAAARAAAETPVLVPVRFVEAPAPAAGMTCPVAGNAKKVTVRPVAEHGRGIVGVCRLLHGGWQRGWTAIGTRTGPSGGRRQARGGRPAGVPARGRMAKGWGRAAKWLLGASESQQLRGVAQGHPGG